MFKFDRDMHRGQVSSITHHFFISEEISGPEDYIDLINLLYSGDENQDVVIHFNTPGGRLDTTMQLLNAIHSTRCNVLGLADGQVASAGSVLLFSCPQIAIQPWSYVMLHDGSEGSFGKLNENLKQAQFSAAFLKRLYHHAYTPFFSKKEIDDILKGQDRWFTSEEVEQRITKVLEKGNND